MTTPDGAAAMYDPSSADPLPVNLDTPQASGGGLTELISHIRELMALDARIKAVEIEAKQARAVRQRISDTIIEIMIENGLDSPPGVDGHTVYLHPVYQVGKRVNPTTEEPYTSADVLTALRASGLGGMAYDTYSGSALRSLLTEYRNADQQPPDALAEVVELKRVNTVQTRPAAATKRHAARELHSASSDD